MGDHFVLLVDHLLTEYTLEAAIGSINQDLICVPTSTNLLDEETGLSLENKSVGDETSTGNLVECRICQDEDEDSNMEIPCSCCGSLKYAHRKCVQRWCNEKGDTICEICLQQFKPGYSAPPKLFLYGSIPMNFRGRWEISRQDINNRQYITMTPSDSNFMEVNDDGHAASNARSIMYCRLAAVIFTVLLVLHHSLPFIINGAVPYSFPLFTLLLQRIAGIILPLYVILRAISTFHRRHLPQLMGIMSNYSLCI